MLEKTPRFNFLATGIGSVPFHDIEATCRDILEHLPSMPFWPQFVKRSHLEGMIIQYSEGLPLLEIKEGEGVPVISKTHNAESELAAFYERFLAQDIDYFSISRSYAPGLYALLELIDKGVEDDGPYIKGQTVGPVTFAVGISGLNGKPILHNPELFGAMARGLAMKALWQARELKKSGKRPIIFLDEPSLSGFGSAFSPIQRDEVVDTLRAFINYLRENSDTLIGIHCCGNTDWPMIMEAGPDIISFDAFDHMDHFLLYPDDIVGFLRGKGTVAWGIVPTSGLTGKESAEDLYQKIEKGLRHVHEWGIDPGTLAGRSILTPACGMGTMGPESAKRGLALLSQLSRMLNERVGI